MYRTICFSKFCSAFAGQIQDSVFQSFVVFQSFAPLSWINSRFSFLKVSLRFCGANSRFGFSKFFGFSKVLLHFCGANSIEKYLYFGNAILKFYLKKTSQSMYCPKTFKTSKILFIFIKIYLKNKITHGNQAHGNQLLSCLIEQ